MLSILIPVYNFDIRSLVYSIDNQAFESGLGYEIVIVDDASNEKYKARNRELNKLNNVNYKELTNNLGRSKIRNYLVNLAKYENLLFLDCDSGIENKDFVKKYIPYLKSHHVIYGGRKYCSEGPKDNVHALHWVHGFKREQIPASVRSLEPNKSFMTNNFVISKSVFNKIRFNEEIKGYGHEDTLFGYELYKNKIAIKHIDNPVEHIGLEPNQVFIRKTKEGIKNLLKILKINGYEKRLMKDVTLLSYYKIVRLLKLDILLTFIYAKFEPIFLRNLLSRKPNLFLFDLYKLSYLCTLNGSNKRRNGMKK